MKYMKMIGLAAIAVAALMAITGAGTASATVICKVTETPCSEANEYPLGTIGEGSLPAGASGAIKGTAGETLITCTEVTIKGVLENKGGATQTIKQGVSGQNVIWRNCSSTMETVKGGEIEIHHIAGTDNGTVTIKGVETTATIAGVSCTYTYGAGTDVGVITGGTAPTMDIKAALPKASGSFLCPQDITGETQGVLTTPVGAAYIEDE